MREQGIVAGGCGYAGSSGSQRRMELRVLCLISYHSAFTDQPGLWVIRDKTWIVPHLSCAAGRSQTWRLAFGICGVVVQLVRTPACQAGGRRFEPGRPRHISKDLRLLTFRIRSDCDANCDITPSKVPPNSPWLACSRRLCLAERLMVFLQAFPAPQGPFVSPGALCGSKGRASSG